MYFWVLGGSTFSYFVQKRNAAATHLSATQPGASSVELEPTQFPFLPREVRIGSQKFHVTIQMHTLT